MKEKKIYKYDYRFMTVAWKTKEYAYLKDVARSLNMTVTKLVKATLRAQMDELQSIYTDNVLSKLENPFPVVFDVKK